MSAPQSIAYRARWVLPGDKPPIHGGVVTVAGDRILSVSEGGAFDTGLEDVVLAPGFVNVHAHLDLSNVPTRKGMPGSFADWLRSVVEMRRTLSPITMEAIRDVAVEMKRRGTALLGDIALGEVLDKAIAADPLAGVTFGEVLGHRCERYEPLLDSVIVDAQRSAPLRVAANTQRRIGVSPHAPYSTSAEVYRKAWQPRCTHWFESPDEMEFLRTGGGPMKEFLQEIGAWPESAPSGRWYGDPWAELLGDPSDWLLVHANFVTPSDLEHATKLSKGMPLRIAYCPRTHAAFGFNEYPLEMFLDAGRLVGLGTDSLASNPDLDVFNEAKFVAERYPQIPGERVLRMVTLDGARLLGCERDHGSLTAGKRADVVMLRSPQIGTKFDWGKFFSEETKFVGWLNHV